MTSAELLTPSRSVTRSPQAHLHVTPEAATVNGRSGDITLVDTSNLSYIESLYHDYLKSPDLVSSEWRDYFRQLSDAVALQAPASPELFKAQRFGDGNVVSPVELDASIQQERVGMLIRNYRAMGHYAAQLDPLGRPRPAVPELDPESCGFSDADLDRHFSTVTASGPNLRTLREILQWLRNTYCRSIGV